MFFMKNKNIILLFALSFLVLVPLDAKKKAKQAEGPKYVFYLIGDGMGVNTVLGTQYYNAAMGYSPEEVNFFNFPVRTFVTTYSASALVTDSAASGTALATGVKTNNSSIGVDKDYKPVTSIAEMAHAAGFGTGVATSVGVNHATPASFYAHVKNRNLYNEIAEQLIATESIDFAAGANFLTERNGLSSSELEAKAESAGISVLRGREQFQGIANRKGRVICFSSNPNESDLQYAIDRQDGATELLDFTRAGIEYLYGNFKDKGFFFMIEGGKIDYAAHADDGVTAFHETNDLARTVDAILEFYAQHPDETLIVVTADHETGACILGAGQYIMNPEFLSVQKSSENVLTDKFRKFMSSTDASAVPDWESVKDFFKTELGLWSIVKLSPADEQALKQIYDSAVSGEGEGNVVSLYAVNSRMVSEAIDILNRSAGYLWAHGSHTGTPVGLYVKGACAASFLECRDNTQIPMKIAELAAYNK